VPRARASLRPLFTTAEDTRCTHALQVLQVLQCRGFLMADPL
jgi:hypothetical protein